MKNVANDLIDKIIGIRGIKTPDYSLSFGLQVSTYAIQFNQKM
jgi:hypothetical protein